MAERYRDPKTGRWVSVPGTLNLAEYIRERFEQGTRKTAESERVDRATDASSVPPPSTREPVPANWTDEPWSGGGLIRTAGGAPLSEDAFYTEFPSGAASFQLRFIVPSNPEYMRGWVSYSTLTVSEWENIDEIIDEMERTKGATGVGAIVFHQYY